MKIDEDFINGLRQTVRAQQGDALLQREEAEKTVQAANDAYHKGLGALEALSAIRQRLAVPEPPQPAPEPAPEPADNAGIPTEESPA
ncbi:hypothetical protein [Bauldia litoralis]|uniref:hypothetical protein n=1 Tax=Bauldia litoralis TaxID=665467 RepID=UPI003263081D